VATRRRTIAVAASAAVLCLAFAGITVPRALRRPSVFPTVGPVEEAAEAAATPPSVAARVRAALARPAEVDSRPKPVASLFHWPEETAAGKTIEALWKEEDQRPPEATPTAPTPESRPAVSEEEIARMRAIVVRGVVLGPKGPSALLSTGRVRVDDVIPGSQFRVASIDARAVTLRAADESVVLPATASRPGRVRSHSR
jgi:hypothetical protein